MSNEEIIARLEGMKGNGYEEQEKAINEAIEIIKTQPNYNEWCTDCKEYNHEKHCCPRWTKVIRNTLNESVNSVLDKIKAEFKSKADGDDWYHTTDGLVWEEAMDIIEKYKSESKI